jgi:hypothetical protein
MSPLDVTATAGGQPSEEELVAILAAIGVTWPRPPAAPAAEEPLSLRWRLSGRWWTRSVISRRDRPWVGPQR